jgi:hypothetical protein
MLRKREEERLATSGTNGSRVEKVGRRTAVCQRADGEKI